MYGRTRKLAFNSLIVMTGFALSRVFGLVRNIVIAQEFGTGREYEAFLAAVEVPDIVFQVLAGGAVASAFIPVFQSYFTHGQEAQAWRMTRSAMTLAAIATAAVSLVLFVLARDLAEVLVPGWNAADKDLTATLMRTMLVCPVLFAVSCFATSVLNSFDRFIATMVAPIFYNLSIITGAYLLQPIGIEGVAIGVVAGALLHLLVQVPGLLKVGMPPRPLIDIDNPGVRQVLRLMVPRMFGLGVVQVNQLVNVVLATYLVVGSLAYLKVAWLMIMTPLALAMSVSTAVFPTLAEESARQHTDNVRQVFVLSLRNILFLTVPMAVGMAVLAEPLVGLLFERGEFTAESTQMTAFALSFYALGLAGHATVEIVDRVFYALHDTRTPVAIAAAAFVVNAVLGLALMRTPLSFGGLALANSLAALAEAIVLMWLISRRLGGFATPELARSLTRIGGASATMGVAVIALLGALQGSFALSVTAERALTIVTVASIGAAIYLSLAFVFRSDELRAFLQFARSRS